MELIRGWEAQYTPVVTGGLQLRKASEYRAIEDDEGVGDMRGRPSPCRDDGAVFQEHRPGMAGDISLI